MIDVKIAATVFASLLIIALALQGTPLTETSPTNQTENQTTEPTQENNETLLNKAINLFQRLTNRVQTLPEPENQVQINIQTPEIQNHTQKIQNAQITPQELTKIQINQQTIETSQPLTLENYTGTLNINTENTTLEGTITQAHNQETTIETQKIHQTIPNNQIQIQNQGKTQLQFQNATGTIQNNQTQVQIQNSQLKIDSYKGNQTIQPQSQEMTLNGKVNQLNADGIQIQ